MATLPPVQLHTVNAIYAARERKHKDWDSEGLPISMVGHECDRALWYTLRWASEPETKTGKKLRRFETGNQEEHRLIDDLRRAGCEVIDTDVNTGRQFKVYLLGGHLRGKLDGKVFGVPEAPETWHVLETKALNEKRFKAVVKDGIEKAEPKHYEQCQLYCYAMGLSWCLYLVVNTNSDELHSERMQFDAVMCARLLERVEGVIGAARAPSRICDDATKWPCVLCEHKVVCHREAFGRNHCRTCIFSTPTMTGNAEWRCAKHDKELSLMDQVKGCSDHLYLPDTVPGEQTDAGDDWVEYRRPDGSIWRDGAPAYDAQKDLAGSLDVGYETIRERVATGGPGWKPTE